MQEQQHNMKSERIWDPLVRLLHWALAISFATAWWIRGDAFIHENAGRAVLLILLLRLTWGIVGPNSARFSKFLTGPLTTLRYLKDILQGHPARFVGHNPAGAAMIIALMLSLFVTAATGVLMSTIAFWGGETIERIHGWSANVSLVLIVGHLIGVVMASIQHKENLPRSMVTGNKVVDESVAPMLGNSSNRRRHFFLVALCTVLGGGTYLAAEGLLNASFWRMGKIIASEAEKAGCENASVGLPAVQIYPTLMLSYGLTPKEKTTSMLVTVPVAKALERKPVLSFPELQSVCKKL